MVSREELLERTEALLPAIASRTGYAADHRTLHEDTVKEIEEAGLLEAIVPEKYGGHGNNIDTLKDIARTLSRACMSTGWVMGFYIGHNWMMTRFTEKAQNEVFADKPYAKIPGQIKPSIKATRVKGGYELNGRASWLSGIMHADWLFTGAGVEGGPPILALMKAGDYAVDDVWDMAGMQGTGSNDVVCNEVFVPDYRIVDIPSFITGETEGNQGYESPMYHMPILPFMYTQVMGILVGGLEGATAEYLKMLKSRDTAFSSVKLTDMQTVHVNIGNAAGRANAGRKLLDSLVEEIIETQMSRGITMRDRLKLKLDAGYIANHCRESVNTLIHQSGGQSFQRTSPIQNHFRDINTLAVHAFWDWHVSREQYGRGEVGLDPNHPLI